MIIGLVVVAAAIVGLVAWKLLSKGKSTSSTTTSSLSVSSTNRLALADKFSMYLDDSGNLTTYGSDLPSTTTFKDLVQISARSSFALGLKKDGTAVCAGAGTACEVSKWSDLTMIAAVDSRAENS